MASSGPNYPATVVNRDVGNSWTNPGNATTDNGSVATIFMADAMQTSANLGASGFGFSIPDGSTITGIRLEVEVWRDSGGVGDNNVRLIGADGSLIGNNKGTGATLPTTEGSPLSYGGDGDLWGATLTPAIVNDADFGAVFSVAGGSSTNVVVDYMRITVFYSPPPTTSTSSSTSTTTSRSTSTSSTSTSFSSTSSSTSSTSAIDILFKPRAQVRSSGIVKPFGI